MKSIINEIKTEYAAEHGKGSWEEFMDWNTLTHSSLERMEKHMDEVISRVEKYYKRDMIIFSSLVMELTAQLEMYQGYESKMTEEAKRLVLLYDNTNNLSGPHDEQLTESRLRLDKLKLNLQLNSLKNYVQSLKEHWEPKTRIYQGRLVHGSKKEDEIEFVQYFDVFSGEWTTEEIAFRGYVLNSCSQKHN